MKRQNYYPRRMSEQVAWLLNYADKLPKYAAVLSLSSEEVADRVADAQRCAYVLGPWLAVVRGFAPAATASMDFVLYGTSNGMAALPNFVPPDADEGTAALKAGAMHRIFHQVGRIKLAAGYTPAIGLDMGLVGSENTMSRTTPKMKLKLQGGTVGQWVRVSFTKHGHEAVYMESRLVGGEWNYLGIDTENPYIDDRPLKVPGVPEVREYRMRFWDKGSPNGPWSAVATVTVSP